MSRKDRLPVLASRGTMVLIKGRYTGAVKAHGLLKKKADAIRMKFRQVAARYVQKRLALSSALKDGNFYLIKAQYIAGNFSPQVLASVQEINQRHISIEYENTAGVYLPILKLRSVGDDMFALTGLGKGGETINVLKKKYTEILKLLVELACLQVNFTLLETTLVSTNTKVNALGYIYIPRLERTMSYIESELDEFQREDFYRMKKVRDKNKKREAKDYKERKEKLKMLEAGLDTLETPPSEGQTTIKIDEGIKHTGCRCIH